ncbi:MAG: hypothetical protein ACO3GM_05550 [Candidatus Limnocylindrus sp.]
MIEPAGPAVLVALRLDETHATVKVGANPCMTITRRTAAELVKAWPLALCAHFGFARTEDADGEVAYVDGSDPVSALRAVAEHRGWIWPLNMGLDDWILSLVLRLHIERNGVAP